MNILAFKMPALALLFKEIFHDAQKSYPPTHPPTGHHRKNKIK
jgi:hypothetical protein